jgi:capsule polysaccharide export protein KpsC/LpsZ
MIRNLFLVGRQWWSLRGNWSPVRVFFGGKLFRSKPRIAALNFASWKRDIFRKALAEFDVKFIRLRDGENSISHAHSKRGFEAIVIWGYPNLDWVDDTAKRLGIPIWRIEDGFLRSVGLGANHVAPLSYFLDRTGIHFDPSTPSDLENTLLTYDFDADPALMERARNVIEGMSSPGISEYGSFPAASEGVKLPRSSFLRGQPDVFVGRGQRCSGLRARQIAEKRGYGSLIIDYGFLRSVGLGIQGGRPLSIIADDIRVYLDASAPPRLEVILQSSGWDTPCLMARAQAAISDKRRLRMSKYNPPRRRSNRGSGVFKCQSSSEK